MTSKIHKHGAVKVAGNEKQKTTRTERIAVAQKQVATQVVHKRSEIKSENSLKVRNRVNTYARVLIKSETANGVSVERLVIPMQEANAAFLKRNPNLKLSFETNRVMDANKQQMRNEMSARVQAKQMRKSK